MGTPEQDAVPLNTAWMDSTMLGMSFLRYFELSQRGRSLTLHAATNP